MIRIAEAGNIVIDIKIKEIKNLEEIASSRQRRDSQGEK
jgi:hypothetical protein